MWSENSICYLASMLLLLLAKHQTEAANQQQQPRESLQAPEQLFGLDFGGSRPLELVEPIYQTSKRARKMSAFMPMRGRKDGRDEQLVQFRELDPDSPSILRLVSTGATLNGLHLSGPRQFAAALRQAADGSSSSSSGADELASEPMMEAKLRRAFHPMRGKKWVAPGEVTGPELTYSDLELGEM